MLSRNVIKKTILSSRLSKTFLVPICGLVFLFNVATGHSAQKSNAASECSAVFFIMTSIEQEEPKLGKHFTKLGQLASAATSIFMGAESNSRVTRGDVSRKKSAQIRRVGELSNRQFSALLETCLGWVSALGKKISQSGRSKSDLKNAILHGPSPSISYDYPYPDSSWVAMAVKKSLRLWKLNGRITPDTLRDLLKKK